MASVRKVMSRTARWASLGVAAIFSILNLAPPAWSQERAAPTDRDAIRALDHKLDLIVEALSQDKVFNERMVEELRSLDGLIDEYLGRPQTDIKLELMPGQPQMDAKMTLMQGQPQMDAKMTLFNRDKKVE